MTTEREAWHKRATAGDLSERQREVVRLIAAGKTNSEIAEHLGISLDGAKYHVRELLRALDLDTREEVAEWWRQQRGMRARFAVTARWSRMPALVKWGLGGAAAAGVVVVAVVMLGLAAGSDDEPDSDVRIAIAVPVESSAGSEEQTGPLREIHLFDGDGVPVGIAEGAARYADFAWSPDGSLLAAVVMVSGQFGNPGGMELELVVFDRSGSRLSEVSLPVDNVLDPKFINWSPDSQHSYLWSNEGTVVVAAIDGSAELLPNLDSPRWSPEGRFLAGYRAGSLEIHKPGDGLLTAFAVNANLRRLLLDSGREATRDDLRRAIAASTDTQPVGHGLLLGAATNSEHLPHHARVLVHNDDLGDTLEPPANGDWPAGTRVSVLYGLDSDARRIELNVSPNDLLQPGETAVLGLPVAITAAE